MKKLALLLTTVLAFSTLTLPAYKTTGEFYKHYKDVVIALNTPGTDQDDRIAFLQDISNDISMLEAWAGAPYASKCFEPQLCIKEPLDDTYDPQDEEYGAIVVPACEIEERKTFLQAILTTALSTWALTENDLQD